MISLVSLKVGINKSYSNTYVDLCTVTIVGRGIYNYCPITCMKDNCGCILLVKFLAASIVVTASSLWNAVAVMSQILAKRQF